MKNIDIIAACSDLGVHVNGSKLGPQILLKNINKNNIKNIKEIHNATNYRKELNTENKKKNLNQINLFNQKLYLEIQKTLENNCLPITIGGDHSIAIASSLASINQYQNLGIIWFDAHGDYNTFETTTTGNIHGLPFAAVTNYHNKLLSSFHNGNFYSSKNAVLLGGREIDIPNEMNNLKDAGVTIITTSDIQKYGIEKMTEKAFEIASHGTNGIHISFDLDCIDPKLAPGVSVPAPHGLNLEETFGFIDYIIKNNEKIKSFDLVEFNPLFDINQKTEKIATDIINKLIINL